jgi:ribosome biogenesis GTPase
MGFGSFELGRVCSEHKERYAVLSEKGEFEGEILGALRYSAQGRSDFPAVGDWVAISSYDEDKVLIHAVLPRINAIEREAVGKTGEKQIIAANIDAAFIVLAVDRDFNLNRVERYITICKNSKVTPIVVLSKTDLISGKQLNDHIETIKSRIKGTIILQISNLTQAGLDELKQLIEAGKTYCLLGSSGVGKSSLINSLSGETMMATGTISASTQKGRHVTSHRELLLLENGGMIIDNPGMREVGIADAAGGLDETFEIIQSLVHDCRFKNCTHAHETGCAVRIAVEKGEISEAEYNNFLKLQKEVAHFESTALEKRKKDKDFGKMVKNIKKEKKW